MNKEEVCKAPSYHWNGWRPHCLVTNYWRMWTRDPSLGLQRTEGWGWSWLTDCHSWGQTTPSTLIIVDWMGMKYCGPLHFMHGLRIRVAFKYYIINTQIWNDKYLYKVLIFGMIFILYCVWYLKNVIFNMWYYGLISGSRKLHWPKLSHVSRL